MIKTTEEIIPLVTSRIRNNYAAFNGKYPAYGVNDTDYLLTPNQNWLAAFWAGMLWLTASHTGDADDLARALSLKPTFIERLDKAIRLNHDVGFLYTLYSRAGWQLTQQDDLKALTLRAAEVLLARFRPVGGYIQAWGELDDTDEEGRFIIDCMMNLPLLFWAGEQTGDSRYTDAATTHAHTSLRYLLRSDGGTYHTYFLDPQTGQGVGPRTHQGFADDSLWSRGQAWAVYGFTLAAEWTGHSELLNGAKRAADRYLLEISQDQISPWDFRLPADEKRRPDSSADAIASGGLLRLAALTGESLYRSAAEARLLMLLDQAFDTRENAQGLLKHGTQHLPHGYGIDTYTIFGDYFFMEAVMTLAGQAPDFWGRQKHEALR